jgi:hypothetical protein
MFHREHGEENFSAKGREAAGEGSHGTCAKHIDQLLQDSEELHARLPQRYQQ